MLGTFSTRFLSRHPSAAAESLETLDAATTAALAAGLSTEIVAPIIARMLPQRAVPALKLVAPERAAALLEALDFPRAIRLMLRLDAVQRAAVLAGMRPLARQAFLRALSFPGDTVGRHMITRVSAFRVRDDVARAVQDLARESDALPVCFVVDGAGRPLGVVKVADLIGAPPARAMADLMDDCVPSISARARLETVREAVLADGIDYLPVSDPERHLVGVLAKTDWLREIERGTERAEAPELVSVWLGIANLFWQVGARMLNNAAQAPGARDEDNT